MFFAAKIWDFLFGLTVLFPLLTGGIWTNKPGFKIELTQISIQLIVLALLAMAMERARRGTLEKLYTIQFCTKLVNAWQSLMQKNPKKGLLGGFLLAGSLWSLVALRRHWAFSSGYADLGIFVNAIWNLTHGNGYISSVKDGVNLFSDHQSPIFYLLFPLFKLLPYPETLLIVQGFTLCSGGIAVYFLGKQYLNAESKILPWLPIIYWMYNPLRNANRFDFHPEVLMVPAFLFGIMFSQTRGWRYKLLGFVFLLLGLAGKESSGPVLAGIALAWILGSAPEYSRNYCRWLGFPMVAVGIVHLYFCTKVIPVYFGAPGYQYQNMYAHFGNGMGDLLLAPIFKTKTFLEYVFGPARIKFFLGTLLPVAFLPLFSPLVFAASLPGYLIYFLSAGAHRLNIGYHYSIESSIGLFWALITSLAKIEKGRFPQNAVYGLLAICLLATYGRSDIYFIRFFQRSPHHSWLLEEVFPLIRKDVSVMSTGTFVPHLATRKWAHHLPVIEMPEGKMVDCIFWSRNAEVNNTPLNAETETVLWPKMQKQAYKEVWKCDGLSVYQNPALAGSCFSREPICQR